MPINENDLSYLIYIVECIMDINEFSDSVEYYKFESPPKSLRKAT